MTKTVIAALGGLAVADILARVLLSRDMSTDQAILIGLVIGLISTMIIVITFEAFANPSRKPVRSEVSNPVIFIQQKVTGVRRSTEIARIAKLDRAFARLMVEHLGPGAQPTAALLQNFLGITNEFGMVMPMAVTRMLRALATLQGSVEMLSPNYPMIDAAQHVAKDEMRNALRPENLADDPKREVIHLAPIPRRAPHHLDRIAGQIEQGNLAFHVRMFSDEDDIRFVSRLINRAILAFIGVVSVMLIQLPNDYLLTDNVGMLQALGFVGLFAGSILIMRVVLEILRKR
jgi:hypothetical protein